MVAWLAATGATLALLGCDASPSDEPPKNDSRDAPGLVVLPPVALAELRVRPEAIDLEFLVNGRALASERRDGRWTISTTVSEGASLDISLRLSTGGVSLFEQDRRIDAVTRDTLLSFGPDGYRTPDDDDDGFPNVTEIDESTDPFDASVFPEGPAPELVERIEYVERSIFVDETTSSVTLSVDRFGSTNGVAVVGYSTRAGTASPGLDYIEAVGEISWAAGESGARNFAVGVLPDDLVENEEFFEVVLAPPIGADGLPVTRNGLVAQIRIVNVGGSGMPGSGMQSTDTSPISGLYDATVCFEGDGGATGGTDGEEGVTTGADTGGTPGTTSDDEMTGGDTGGDLDPPCDIVEVDVTPDGRYTVHDFRGDTVDRGPSCYSSSERSVVRTEADVYRFDGSFVIGGTIRARREGDLLSLETVPTDDAAFIGQQVWFRFGETGTSDQFYRDESCQ